MAKKQTKKQNDALKMSFRAYTRWKFPLHVKTVALEMSRRPVARRAAELATELSMGIDEVKAALRVMERYDIAVRKETARRGERPAEVWSLAAGHWLLRIWESRGADASDEQAGFHDKVAELGWDHSKVTELLQGLSDMGILDVGDALSLIGKADAKAAERASAIQADRKADVERRARAKIEREERKEERLRANKRGEYQHAQNEDEADRREKAAGAKIELENPPPPPIPVSARPDIQGNFSLAEEDDDR
jgi:hypothetical protein